MFSDSRLIGTIPILHRERKQAWDMWVVRTETQIFFLKYYKFKAVCKHLLENHIYFRFCFLEPSPIIRV